MAPPVWTLVLLFGAAWGQDHMPAPIRKEKPPDWKKVVRTSRDSSIITQCDFEDNSKPLCDWTQVSTDDGDWTRASGPPPNGSTGPPGGYPNGEGYYLHMDSSAFHRGGVAGLRSAPIWEKGPLCVHFAYHMFGLSWGTQLKLLLFKGPKSYLLWRHVNTQSPSWMPTAVTVPMGHILPSRLVFEGVRGNTAYLDIALDSISIHRGSCHRVCTMQVCSFDTLNDLCGWSWVPSASGAKWTQRNGSSGVPKVGPQDDFSNPGSGFYMLLDPKNAKPNQKSVLLSPLTQSSGCLSLSFHYVLRGQAPGAALIIYASVLGNIRKHTLFSGQPGPTWQPVSVNYSGQGQIQFTVVGVFGETPEPAVAVDAISIAPCGESLPQCDFEDDGYPFCTWAQALGNAGQWVRRSKHVPTQGMDTNGVPLNTEGHFIYLKADKSSQAGQSFRLVSRPFCAPDAVCVGLTYRMYGLGNGSGLKLLLESPAGSSPSLLWHRIGFQSYDWMNVSITIPEGHQQPMQLILEATRGSNTAFVIAVDFIVVHHGACQVSCPSNAHYERCACPASCKNPKPHCWHHCQPGCVCNSGFLFSNSSCVKASSCSCFYNNNYYKVGAMWFSPNCTEHCRCLPGGQKECQVSRCRKNTVCQMKNGQYGCHPYGSAICFVYGDPHYLTFDGRPFSFMGKCTYILAQPCGNSTEPFFRVVAKNEERVQEGMSCLNKVYVTLHETTITLLKGRQTLVGGLQVNLPILLKKGIYLAASGRFVEVQTTFGLRIRWDGDQQLSIIVPSTYSGKLCGFCGNYDGDSSNDNKKPDGTPAQDQEELGNSWQIVDNEDKECQRSQEITPSCDSSLLNSLSGPEICGQLVASHGAFEACLPHIMTFSFFDNCMLDMCNFQGLQQMLCSHLSALTETCQEAGYAVKPWRGPQFCPLICPPNSRYTLCASLCPNTCHPQFNGMSCQERCVEGCECNPGYILSGFDCVPRSQCGCLDAVDGYFKVGEKWYKPGCRQLCVCEKSFSIHCFSWKCQAQEVCSRQNGIYGCHAQSSATCTISGDPHYLTFDGALHHFMGTCTYTLTQPCQTIHLEDNFIVSATNEFRSGNPEVTYVTAVHVKVFKLQISLLKGHRVMLNNLRVTLPVWPAQGRLVIRPSGSFILLHTDFGLQVRYDGNHLVEVTVPSSYAGRLCGLCGNYNNNSLDDNLQPDRKPANSSLILGAAWKSKDLSEEYCYVTGLSSQPTKCLKKEETDAWKKNCDILMNPRGPFSQCHQVVSPKASFSSCKYDQCWSKGSTQILCRSLQAYAAHCALAGHAPAWRNSTFCPLRCPSGSTYSPCASPCPATCLSLNAPRDCPTALPCAEGCECQKGHVLSGTSCVPLSQCGCTDQWGSYYPVGENWYTDKTCSRLCTCSTYNNISCQRTSCKYKHMCWPMEGRIRCLKTGSVTCYLSDEPYYVSFDGRHHGLGGNCTYTLVKMCHFNRRIAFFKITGKNGKSDRPTAPFSLSQIDMYIYHTRITLEREHRVLINGTQVQLPARNQIPNVVITSDGNYTVIDVYIGIKVQFDGRHLQVVIPSTYHNHVCGLCGNFNAEAEDELMMPNDELASNDMEFVDSWVDEESDQNCKQKKKDQEKEQEKPEINCRQADLSRVQKQCQAALQAPAWANCGTRVVLEPFLLGCTHHLCEFGGLNNALCEFLQGFEAACQAHGLKPPIWRNSSFCPLECPTHSTYTNCLPSCLPSCRDPDGQCKGRRTVSTCQEGCLCQPGLVLSEKQCVPRSQCGCKDARLGSVTAGKTWLSSRCTQSCVCTAGAIQCRPFTCPSGSYCKTKPTGLETCEPIPLQCPANSSYTACMPSCLLSCGDPDNKCKGSSDPSSCREGCICRPGFLLSVKQCVPRSQCGCKDSQLGSITAGKTWLSSRCTQSCVCTAGAIECLPFTCPSGSYCKTKPTGLETCEPIPLQCPANSSYTACMPSCLLSCGDPDNKCKGSSDPSSCREGCICRPGFLLSEKQCVPRSQCGCKDSQLGSITAGKTWLSSHCTQSCVCTEGAIQCQPFTCPAGSYCKTKPTGLETCEPISLQCPANSSYTACMPSCLLSCGDPDDKCKNSPGPSSCREGCICRPGFLLSEKQCVPKSQCGCKDAQLGYIPPRKIWFTNNCTKRCFCAAGVIYCRNFVCPSSTLCHVNATGLDKCKPVALQCPANSSYTTCVPSCFLMCGDPDNKCDSVQVPSSCQEGCICRPGFVLSEKQCVPRSQCGCKDTRLGSITAGKTWLSSRCTQSCVCTEGAIQCRPFTCPFGSHCKPKSTGRETCEPIRKRLLGKVDKRQALQCPANSSYTVCLPSCLPSCRDPDAQCNGGSTANSCQEGCLCHPGFVLSEKQCVPRSQCGCKDPQLGFITAGKTWLSSRCTQSCVCTARGIQCQTFTCPAGSYCKTKPTGLETCEPIPLQCPANSNYTACMPSCFLMCGDPDNKCTGSPAPSSCREGCVCWPGFLLSEKQCVPRSQCGCKDTQLGSITAGKTWLSSRCTQSCVCTAGAIQCRPFTCPAGSYCKTKPTDLETCEPIPLQCPANSSYTTCVPSCFLMCGDPDNKCDSVQVPSSCQEGCVCWPGFLLSEKQCVPRSQCGCKDARFGFITAGKTWLSSRCTQSCVCTAGAIQCRPFTCPSGSYCKTKPTDLETCEPIPLQCPANSSYTACMPSCLLSCKDPDNKCTGSPAPSSCQEGCICRPGFLLSEKQCVPRSQCGCTETLVGYMPEGKNWLTSNCTKRCFCAAGVIYCQNFVCPTGTQCQVNATGPDKCEPVALQCPANSKYTSCMPSCLLSCGDPDNKCDSVQVPSSCREGCVCQPGFLLNEKQCVPRSQCGCKDAQLGYIPEGKFWLTSHCSRRCICAIGAIQCQPFTCPTGTQCQINSSALENCAPKTLQCPAYSNYTACLPSCLSTCEDPDALCRDMKVPSTCREGCLCQSGLLLHEGQCVSKNQCGCKDSHGPIPEGKIWLSGNCTLRCICMSAIIRCHVFECPLGFHCRINSDGKGNCVPSIKRVLRMVKQEAGPEELTAESAQCSVFGDPHYFTFDGFSYRFQGRMTYTLVKTVDVLPEGLEPLVVEGRNKMNLSWSPILHEVIVKIYGYTVQLQAKLQLVVNKQRMVIPYIPSKHFGVTMRGHRLHLTTDFELVVSFDGINNAVISLPGTYEGLVRGLCGNFDKNMTNEFIMPNGALTQNINIFGNSWEVKNQKELARFSRAIREEKDEQEKGKEPDSHVPGCSMEQLALINRTQGCTVLVDPHGPFAPCHQKVAPERFQEHCVFDLCSTWDPKEQEELRCQVLSGYAVICQEAGITLASWRDYSHCALACPANTVYQSCMTPCPASCASLVAPRDCQGPCVEGCASLPGYIYSGVESLPPARCGCTNNGIYYQQGDSFVTEDCSQRCTCASLEVLLCEPLSCNVGEICTLGNLTRGCFRESPCLENPCQNDGRCREQGDHFICECELGYGGNLCMEPQDVPPPAKYATEGSNLVTILLGMVVPAAVMVLAVIGECKKRMRRVPREKMQSKDRNGLVDSDFVPESAFTQF
ncbi:zonadhesin [Talpa occidentalis]|uniref:zonadhesin n=1 Tax=Talpa occidentalis TaxID=50954 RepID=UPI0023F7565F|nr:zonadhesin [Talpa occidentalis]